MDFRGIFGIGRNAMEQAIDDFLKEHNNEAFTKQELFSALKQKYSGFNASKSNFDDILKHAAIDQIVFAPEGYIPHYDPMFKTVEGPYGYRQYIYGTGTMSYYLEYPGYICLFKQNGNALNVINLNNINYYFHNNSFEYINELAVGSIMRKSSVGNEKEKEEYQELVKKKKREFQEKTRKSEELTPLLAQFLRENPGKFFSKEQLGSKFHLVTATEHEALAEAMISVYTTHGNECFLYDAENGLYYSNLVERIMAEIKANPGKFFTKTQLWEAMEIRTATDDSLFPRALDYIFRNHNFRDSQCYRTDRGKYYYLEP